MNWKERYATEKDAGRFRKKMMEVGLRAIPGVGKGTGKALAEGAETFLSGGTVSEAAGAAAEEFGPLGRGVAKALQDPEVQQTVTKGIGKLKEKLMGPSTSPTVPSSSTSSWDPNDPLDFRNVKPKTTTAPAPNSSDEDDIGI